MRVPSRVRASAPAGRGSRGFSPAERPAPRMSRGRRDPGRASPAGKCAESCGATRRVTRGERGGAGRRGRRGPPRGRSRRRRNARGEPERRIRRVQLGIGAREMLRGGTHRAVLGLIGVAPVTHGVGGGLPDEPDQERGQRQGARAWPPPNGQDGRQGQERHPHPPDDLGRTRSDLRRGGYRARWALWQRARRFRRDARPRGRRRACSEARQAGAPRSTASARTARVAYPRLRAQDSTVSARWSDGRRATA